MENNMAEKEVNTNETTAEPSAEQSIELTVNDLNALKQIIDVASSRGAFKPNEMTTIGTVYTKLENFLNAVAAQQQAAGGKDA